MPRFSKQTEPTNERCVMQFHLKAQSFIERMGKRLISCGLVFSLFLTVIGEQKNQFDTFHTYKDVDYNQPYRPKFHFTSLKNWINDPNGLLYYDGEYHLFFQHNPLGNGWGNMAWGHAVSTDMIHWKQLDHAILPYGNGYIFSGTGVVDHNNSLGVQVGETKTLVLMYSYALDTRPHFGVLTPPEKNNYYQGIAYSTDRGRTFKLWNEGKPVIPNQGPKVDPKGTERDPKIFWHAASQKWVAILWMGESSKGRVRFFTSDNLRDWKFSSDLIRKWAHECFDLVYLPVVDEYGKSLNEKKWLIYDGNLDYEVGSFDGEKFQAEQAVRNHKVGHWNAAQTFNNSPDERSVIMGWLQRTSFRQKKMPFSQQLSFPASLHLQKSHDGYQLCRWPIKEIEKLYSNTFEFPENQTIAKANKSLAGINAEAMDIHIEFEPKQTDLTINIRGSELTYEAEKKQLNFLSASNIAKKSKPTGVTPKEKRMNRVEKYRLRNALQKDTVKLRILVDRGSFEIFLNGGISVLTFSELSELDNLSISFAGTEAIITSMKIHEIKSYHKGVNHE